MLINKNRIFLLGSYLDPLTMEETLTVIEDIIQKRQPTQHVVINASKINLMSKDPTLKRIINQSQLINADGQSIVWAARLFGYNVPERVAGIDLFEKLVARAAANHWRLYYLGGTEEVVRTAIHNQQDIYPKINIVGFHNGYFTDLESLQIASEIRDLKVDLLFVGFSSPKKEKWIDDHQPIMQVPFAMGVGGSFDVIAGKTKRAPLWIQKIGMEWFFRFVQEPKRMFRRYIIGNFLFAKRVWQEKQRIKKEIR